MTSINLTVYYAQVRKQADLACLEADEELISFYPGDKFACVGREIRCEDPFESGLAAYSKAYGASIYMGIDSVNGFFSFQLWQDNKCLRRLSYDTDWQEVTGEPQSWEAEFFQGQIPIEGQVEPGVAPDKAMYFIAKHYGFKIG